MHSLPFKHKGIMTAPLLGEISIAEYLKEGQIEQVICGGENYRGARECRYEWVKRLRDECVEADVSFAFVGTGNNFVKDGKVLRRNDVTEKAKAAFDLKLSYVGKPIKFKLTDRLGLEIDESCSAPIAETVRFAVAVLNAVNATVKKLKYLRLINLFVAPYIIQ